MTFQRSFPGAHIYPVEPIERPTDVPPSETYDVACLAGDLPARYRRRIEDFPDNDFVLQPDPSKQAFWQSRLDTLGDGLKIGICWRSEIVNWFRMRNAFYSHIDEWGDILTIPETSFVNLYYGECAQELEQVEKQHGVTVHQWPDLDLRDDLESVFPSYQSLISSLRHQRRSVIWQEPWEQRLGQF